MRQPIKAPLRAWFAVEVLFGVLAIGAVGLRPGDTDSNFAWTIKPTVMAATLGAFYMASAPLFFLPILAKRWEMVRAMILPPALFSAIQLLVTFMHWDKFDVGSRPFYVWFVSYLLPPPIFVAGYWWHQRHRAEERSSSPLNRRLRAALVVLGALFLLVGFAMLIHPSLVTNRFAWKLTPLTARSLSGWLVAFGSLQLSIARENDRARTRLASPFMFIALPALILQLGRYHDEVDWSNVGLWIGLFMVAALSTGGVILALGSWRESLAGS